MQLEYFWIFQPVNLHLIIVKIEIILVRVLGILQRISICYGLLACIHFITDYGNKAYRYIGTVIAISAALIYLVFMLSFENLDINCPH